MNFIKSLTDWIGINIDFPAVILLMLLIMGAYVMWKTQSNPNNNFDFSEMLRDDSGKPSAFRMGIFVSMALSSWGLMYVLIHNQGHVDTIIAYMFIAYMAIWSGAKIVEKAIDTWAARGQPMTLQRTTQTTDTAGNTTVRQVSQTLPVVPAVDTTQVGDVQQQ